MILSGCDVTLLLTFLLRETVPSQYGNVKRNYYYVAIFAWLIYPCFFISAVAGTWILVAMTFNRFIMITYPTRAKILCTTRRSMLGIVAIVCLAVMLSLPQFFVHTVVKSTENGNVSIWRLTHTEYGLSSYSKDYEFWMHCMVMVLLPWFFIAYLNTNIILRMYEQVRRFHRVAKGKLKKINTRYGQSQSNKCNGVFVSLKFADFVNVSLLQGVVPCLYHFINVCLLTLTTLGSYIEFQYTMGVQAYIAVRA